MMFGLLAIFAGRQYANECWRASGVFLILLVLIGYAVSAWAACGDCSAGYCCAAGWWIWRRRHPAWALASLLVGLAFGLWIGLQCVATGRHPFSDSIWSALLIFGLAHLLYYHALRMQLLRPAADGASDNSRQLAPRRLPGLRMMLLLLILALIAHAPHGGQPTDRARVALSPLPQQPAPDKAQP
jgi:ribose/xylose/arabinose/galactoside ABC-type transport system permease subunit